MRPAARVQAAIDLLDEIIVAARDGGASADMIAKRYFATRRYAGSKDRRAIRELSYRAIRRFGDRPENGRAAMIGLAQEDAELAALFDGSDYGPKSIGEGEAGASGDLLPAWLDPLFAELVDAGERAALLDRASLDVRSSLDLAAMQQLWPEAEALPLAGAYRLPGGTAIDQSAAYRAGQVEIQDLGSQAIVAALSDEKPQQILDLCAGAGGKTLALAALFPDVPIIASDVDRRRLGELDQRAKRAGATNIETRLLNPGKEAEALSDLQGAIDIVLVDAPCSGTGTWRRNPELRWRMTEKRLERTTETQMRLIELASGLVRPGGLLSYAVCSLLDREGADQVEAFLQKQPDWSAESPDLPIGRQWRKGMLFTPFHDGTDGFFLTHLRKAC